MPTRQLGEPKDDFLSRCMGDYKMKQEFPDNDQRFAVCQNYAEAKVEKTDASIDTTMSCTCGGNTEATEEPMADEDAGYPPNCNEGYEEKDGACMKVSVMLDLDISDVDSMVEASTGKTLMRISGIAFHEGYNKNNWAISKDAAIRLAEEMKGLDLTLHHPDAEHGHFTRNMNGEVEKSTIGEIVETSFEEEEEDKWNVRYVANVYREELFESLESGLWLKGDYGVSIGGTGVPDIITESEEGKTKMFFDSDFTLDHLAIVYRPAYPRANIEEVEKIVAEEMVKYEPDSLTNQPEVNEMSDEVIETPDYQAEIESLKADLVLREAKISEFENEEAVREEESRLELVNKATEVGLKGHDDFTKETLEQVIASWEASRPEPQEMAPATPATSVESETIVVEENKPVVANYLNGTMVESDESVYSRAYNSWVAAWNGAYNGVNDITALTYEETKTN